MFGAAVAFCVNDPNSTAGDCLKLALLNLPDVVWSGITGAVITLLGVFVANWFFGKRASEQLAHDAQQNRDQLDHKSTENDKDRKKELRQEVYLEAIAELSKATATIAALSLDRSDNSATLFLPLFTSLHRMLLVCDSKNTQLVLDVNAALAILVMNAQAKLVPIVRHRNDIDIYLDLIAQFRAEIKRILAAQVAFNEGVEKPAGVFESLNKSFEFNNEQLHVYQKARAQSASEFQDGLEEYGIFVTGRVKQLAPLQNRLISAMRVELTFDGNLAQLDASMNAYTDKLNQALEEIMQLSKQQRGAS
jgi:hypothetical protein